MTFLGGNLAAPVKAPIDLRTVPEAEALTTIAAPNSPEVPFLFAVSDLPEVIEPAEAGYGAGRDQWPSGRRPAKSTATRSKPNPATSC